MGPVRRLFCRYRIFRPGSWNSTVGNVPVRALLNNDMKDRYC